MVKIIFISVRFPELPEKPNWQHNHSQHHYQHRGLPAASPGVYNTNIRPQHLHTRTCAVSLSKNVILLSRNPSVTSTGTTLAKMSLMRLEESTSPKLYLLPSRYSTL